MNDTVIQLTERYNREARAYQELWAPILRIAGSSLLGRIPGAGIHRILDLGSGVGGLIPDLMRTFPDARILAVDRSPGMLCLSQHQFPRAIMDAGQLALSSESIDLVMIVFVLFHVPEPENSLREMRRVLRPGGHVGCTTWGAVLDSPASRIWIECLDAFRAAAVDPATVTRHDEFNTAAKMKRMFEEAGFPHVDSWEEELAPTIGKDQLIGLRTSLDSLKPRFESLTPAMREACLTEASRRMDALAPEDFVARGMVVQTIAGV